MRPTITTSLETHSLSTQTSNIHRESLRTVEISSQGSNLQLKSPDPRSGTRNEFRTRITPHPVNTRNADVPVSPHRLRPTKPTPSLEKINNSKIIIGKNQPASRFAPPHHRPTHVTKGRVGSPQRTQTSGAQRRLWDGGDGFSNQSAKETALT
jgi:hypothetical protein